jgi:hypothetical protein
MPFCQYRASFDPETLAVLQTVFDTAWAELLATGSVLVSDANRDQTRTMLAKRIIAAAENGERDQATLKLAALRND